MELVVNAAPTVATMTSYTLMQFVDKLMCSRISEDAIWVGAQGNGGVAAWVPVSVSMGLVAVVNSFVSQNLGAGKPERGAAYAWNGLWIAVATAIVLLPYAFLMRPMFEAMGHEPRRAELAAEYGKILVLGAIFTLSSRAISHYFYGMHRPGVILAAGLIGNLLNVVLNYVLIYGHFGFPRMELRGAAIATVIGTTVELLIPMFVFLVPMHRRYGTRRQWKPSWSHIKEIVKVGWPGGATWGNEMFCWSFFMVYLVGQFGPQHSTAGWIAHQWMTLSFMPIYGLSIALTAAVGKQMGAKKPDEAARRAYLGLGLALLYMGACAICFIVFRAPMARLFIDADTPAAEADTLIRLAGGFLIATAAFQVFDAIAMSLSGALRGAGDTVWIGVVTVVLSWSVIVLGGWALVRFVPTLGSLGPWIAAATYIFLLAIAVGWRFTCGRWRSLSLVRAEGAVVH